ncbi:class I SAM-dependent methyltransferase [Natronospora cellulosivora (SeqCode)]
MSQEKGLNNLHLFNTFSLKDLYSRPMVKTIKLFLRIVQSFEYLGSSWPLFGNMYRKLFYNSLMERETAMADLKEGLNILHIGSGPLPMTAIFLAENGYSVTGIDNNQKAIKASNKLIDRLSLNDKIEIKNMDGKEVDISKYDAIWLSLHIVPKEDVIKDLLKSLKPGQKIIFRNPRSYLSIVYPRVQEEEIRKIVDNINNLEFENLNIRGIKQSIAKESLLIEYKKKGCIKDEC